MTVGEAAWQRVRGGVRVRTEGIPSAYWWVWSGTLITRLGYFVQPFLVLYLTAERGVSAGQAGMVLAGFGAGSLVSQPLGGWLADRLGQRRALTVGLAASAGSLLALGAARQLPLIVVAAALTGCCLDLYRPASQALVAGLVDPQVRPRAYALLYWAVNLGYAVGTASAGFLASRGYYLLFVIDAATSLVFAALIAYGLRTIATATQVQPARGGKSAGGLVVVFRDRLLLAFTAITLVYAMIYLQVTITLPLAIRDAGLSTTVFGLLMSINGILIVVVQPLTLRLLDRVDPHRLLAAGQFLVGAGFALTAWCDSAWQFAGSVVVWTAGEIATAGTVTAVIAGLAPVERRGRYLGVAGSAWGAAALLGPVIGTAAYAASPGALWTGCLVAGCLCAAAQRLVSKRLASRSHAEQPESTN
jgi:MFS family permease